MSYTAIVTREGDDWLGDVPALQGASTYGTTLGNLIANLQEVIILADDLGDDALPDLDLEIQDDDPALRQAVRVRNRRRELEREMDEIQSETRRVVTELIEGGYSMRDTAAAVGVTSGRVSQLTHPADEPNRLKIAANRSARKTSAHRATTIAAKRAGRRQSSPATVAAKAATSKKKAATKKRAAAKTGKKATGNGA